MANELKLGERIRELRESACLSWGDLAEAANITAPQVALMESGTALPTISTLKKIAKRMDIRVGTLLDGTENRPEIANSKEAAATINLNTNQNSHNLGLHSLAGNKLDRNMEPFYVDVHYSEASQGNLSSYEGEEFIYILEGEVELLYGGDCYHMAAGESLYFDSIVPHLLRTPSEEKVAKALTITYRPD